MSRDERPNPSPAAQAPDRQLPATRAAVFASLAVVLVHIVIVWRYPSIFWGDNGRWLHELDRVAHGATFYRDIYWAFPPLAMWILGGLTRVIGSDLIQVWSLTAAVAIAIAAVYGAVVARIVSGSTAVVIAATGMLLGATYSQQASAPLALGMYSPAVPIAMLCLLLQLLTFLRDWERPSLAGALVVGALGGLGFLAKHDVWFACAWLAFAAGSVTVPGREGRTKRLFAAGGAYAAVAAGGLAILAAQHGIGTLPRILTGFGHVEEFSGINLPDMSLLTVEVATCGLLIALSTGIAWLGGIWRGRRALATSFVSLIVAGAAMALWLWKAEVIAKAMIASGPLDAYTLFQDALRPVKSSGYARLLTAFGVLRLLMLRHLVPTLVPLGVLAWLIARRRVVTDQSAWRLASTLVVACVAMRARRMISFTEWSELMLELPVYALSLSLLWPAFRSSGQRTVQLACLVLACFALRMHWRFGYGVGSRRGVEPLVQTARGGARLFPGLARDYAYIRDLANSVDPTGTRPIFAFGYSAGLSYFTGRPSVDPLTQGFRLSLLPTPDSAYRIAAAMKSRLLVVDNHVLKDAIPSGRFAPWRWMPEMVTNPYERVDRPLFDKLREGCREVTLPGRRSLVFTMYDCAAAGEQPVPKRPS